MPSGLYSTVYQNLYKILFLIFLYHFYFQGFTKKNQSCAPILDAVILVRIIFSTTLKRFIFFTSRLRRSNTFADDTLRRHTKATDEQRSLWVHQQLSSSTHCPMVCNGVDRCWHYLPQYRPICHLSKERWHGAILCGACARRGILIWTYLWHGNCRCKA